MYSFGRCINCLFVAFVQYFPVCEAFSEGGVGLECGGICACGSLCS